ncbi:hypothetical protein TNCV_2187491 [Trichonephila clavipes]|nr:hypothetical protein TNCV_2187491 [Trichonephila clavipes]
MVSDADSCAVGLEFESQRRQGCLQMYSEFAAWGTINSHRAADTLVKVLEWEESWEANDPLGCSPSKLGWKRPKLYCNLHGGQSYGQRQAYNLARCPDEFRGPRSHYVKQVALATTT